MGSLTHNTNISNTNAADIVVIITVAEKYAASRVAIKFSIFLPLFALLGDKTRIASEEKSAITNLQCARVTSTQNHIINMWRHCDNPASKSDASES